MPNGKFRFGAIYSVGAAMGFTPQQINAMSMWQFSMAYDGYTKANTQDDGTLTSEEVDDVWKWLNESS